MGLEEGEIKLLHSLSVVMMMMRVRDDRCCGRVLPMSMPWRRMIVTRTDDHVSSQRLRYSRATLHI